MIQINNLDEMVLEYFRALIQSKYPNTDTSDISPIVDLVSIPSRDIAKSVISIGTDIEARSNLDNAGDMSEEDMDEVGLGNYMISRNQGEKAVGTATMKFKSISDSQNTTIPSGVSLSTKSGYAFVTTTSISLTPSEMYQKWNPTDLTYDVDVPVESELTGSAFNIDAAQLTTIANGFTSYEVSVTNNASFTGGSDKESNEDYAGRILKYLSSRTLETSPGYEQDVKENFPEVKDVYVAGYGDALMVRDLAESITIGGVTYNDKHVGGKTDIYIRGFNTQFATISHTVKKTMLFPMSNLASIIDAGSVVVTNVTQGNADIASFTTSVDANDRLLVDITGASVNESDVIKFDYNTDTDDNGSYETPASDSFTYQTETHVLKSPFLSVTSLENKTSGGENGLFYDVDEGNGDYSVTYTDSDYINTSNEEATLELLVGAADSAAYGDQVDITYTYNETIYGLGEHYNENENRVVTRDLLIKESTPNYAHVGMSVKLAEGIAQSDSVESAIMNVLTSMLDDTTIGSKIDESDIINELYDNDNTGVLIDYIQLPLSTFHFTTNSADPFANGTHDGSTVQLGSVEYPSLMHFEITYL